MPDEIKNGRWPRERIMDKLKQNHDQENGWNKEMSRLFWEKTVIEARMGKLRQMISSNTKYRTLLTTFLEPPEPTKKK